MVERERSNPIIDQRILDAIATYFAGDKRDGDQVLGPEIDAGVPYTPPTDDGS